MNEAILSPAPPDAEQAMPTDITPAPPLAPAIDYLALGERLRAYRIGASLQAEDVAAQLGVSRVVVYRMERGGIVKIETLARLAQVLGTSLASLLGVEVEYYSTALGLLERMRQVEQTADRIVAHFEPISLLLTSDDYPRYLRQMLVETTSRPQDALRQPEVDQMMDILQERKQFFARRQPHIVSLIGLRELERFVHTGLVGRLDLPAAVRAERVLAARREVENIAALMASEPMNVQIGLVDDTMPASTFQIATSGSRSVLTVSPFRFGELPNVRNGIATFTASGEAVQLYEAMVARLWAGAQKGRAGAERLRKLLARIT